MFRKTVLITFALLSLPGNPSRAQVAPLWAKVYNAPGNNADFANAMTVDLSGNIYLAGEGRVGAGTDSIDYMIVKADPNGDTLWVRYYNGTGKRDVVRAIAVDKSGNVYVTGESIGSTDFDIATVKFNAAGDLRWAVRYNGPANGADGGLAIAIDSTGNVIVTGSSDGDPSTFLLQDDIVTLKYDSAGGSQWAKRYDGPGSFHDVPHAIGVDLSGSVFVTGQSSGSGTRYDYVTIKYTPLGDTSWVRRYNGPANFDDKPYALAVGRNGELYVTGSSDGASADNEDFATIKYSAAGVEEWVARYAGPGGGDEAFAIAIDSAGSNLYVTGQSRGPASPFSYDYLTIRYNTNGDTLWTARYDGDFKGLDLPLSVDVDRSGNSYVTGYSAGNGTGLDIATVSYDPAGHRRWYGRYTSAGAFNDLGVALRWDRSGYLYVGGTAYGGTPGNDFILLKYLDTDPAVSVGSETKLPGEFSLSQNYPNPFNPSTTIDYQLPLDALVVLHVYDMLGREIATLVNGRESAGRHSVRFDASGLPSGVYFYRLTSGGVAQSRKFVLLR